MNMYLPLAAALLLTTPLAAQDVPERQAAPPEGGARAISIRPAAGPIRVDGVLDDGGWADAVRVTGFTEAAPRSGATPPRPTEVLLTYDERNLYVAFIAHDDPAAVRATWQNRDQIWNDDFVGILIDPYGTAETGYFLLANPFGIQGDLLNTSRGEDDSWDAIFESRGRITATGYVVEMAIPFRSLRFPDRPVQSWRINLFRNLPRASRHQIFWAPLSDDNPCLLCQSAELVGLEGIRPGGGLELLPSVVASRAGRLADPADARSFSSANPTAQLSLGAKYAFSAGWTVDATVNPDFSQVESDAAQIDVNSTFALSYPERRPFFQEGSDLYETPVNVFHSRSINAPQVATKLTGRAGRTSVGFVGARDEVTPYVLPFEERSLVVRAGPSVNNVLRVRHNLDDGAFVGALLTDRRLEGGGAGTNLGVDAFLRFGGVYSLSAQLIGSQVAEPSDTSLTRSAPPLRFGRGATAYTAAFDGERFGGRAAQASLSRSARRWSFNASYAEASPTYRADLGFQTRNDFRRTSGSTSLTFRPQRWGIERITPNVGGGMIWNFGGAEKDAWLRPGLSLLLPAQTNVGLGAIVSRETFRGTEFDGIRRASLFVSTTPSAAVQGGFRVESGRSIARTQATPVLGQGLDAEIWANLRPTERLVLRPSIGYGRLGTIDGDAEFYAGYIARVRTEYQFSRELSFRLVTQYNDFGGGIDLEPLLVYRLNPFSIFYVGSSQGYREFDGLGWRGAQRQYFLKFQYLFRL